MLYLCTNDYLKVNIPWGCLNSKPVKVVLQGVSVLVGPVDRDSWGDEKVFVRRLAIKRAALRKAEEKAAVPKTDKDPKGGDDTYKQVIFGSRRFGVLVLRGELGRVEFALGETVLTLCFSPMIRPGARSFGFCTFHEV